MQFKRGWRKFLEVGVAQKQSEFTKLMLQKIEIKLSAI